MTSSSESICSGSKKLSQVRERYGLGIKNSNTNFFSLLESEANMEEAKDGNANWCQVQSNPQRNNHGNTETLIAVLKSFQFKLSTLQEKLIRSEKQAALNRDSESTQQELIRILHLGQKLSIFTHDYDKLFKLTENNILEAVDCKKVDLFVVIKNNVDSESEHRLWTVDRDSRNFALIEANQECYAPEYSALKGKRNIYYGSEIYPTVCIPIFDQVEGSKLLAIGVIRIEKPQGKEITKQDSFFLENFCTCLGNSIRTCNEYFQLQRSKDSLEIACRESKQQASISSNTCIYLQKQFAEKIAAAKESWEKEKSDELEENNQKWTKEIEILKKALKSDFQNELETAENEAERKIQIIDEELQKQQKLLLSFKEAIQSRCFNPLVKAYPFSIDKPVCTTIELVDGVINSNELFSLCLCDVVTEVDYNSGSIWANIIHNTNRVAYMHVTSTDASKIHLETNVIESVQSFAKVYVLPVLQLIWNENVNYKNVNEIKTLEKKSTTLECCVSFMTCFEKAWSDNKFQNENEVAMINRIIKGFWDLKKAELVQLSLDEKSSFFVDLAVQEKTSRLLPISAFDEKPKDKGSTTYLYLYDTHIDKLTEIERQAKNILIPFLCQYSSSWNVRKKNFESKAMLEGKLKKMSNYKSALHDLLKNMQNVSTDTEILEVAKDYAKACFANNDYLEEDVSQLNLSFKDFVSRTPFDEPEKEVLLLVLENASGRISTLNEFKRLQEALDHTRLGAELLQTEMETEKAHIEQLHNELASGALSCHNKENLIELISRVISKEYPFESCHLCVRKDENTFSCFGTKWEQELSLMEMNCALEWSTISAEKPVVYTENLTDGLIHKKIRERIGVQVRNLVAFPLKVKSAKGLDLHAGINQSRIVGIFVMLNVEDVHGFNRIEPLIETLSPIVASVVQNINVVIDLQKRLNDNAMLITEDVKVSERMIQLEALIYAKLSECDDLHGVQDSLLSMKEVQEALDCRLLKLYKREMEFAGEREIIIGDTSQLKIYPLNLEGFELHVIPNAHSNENTWSKIIEPMIFRLSRIIQNHHVKRSMAKEIFSAKGTCDKLQKQMQKLQDIIANGEKKIIELTKANSDYKEQLLTCSNDLKQSRTECESLRKELTENKLELEELSTSHSKILLEMTEKMSNDAGLYKMKLDKLTNTLEITRSDLKRLKQKLVLEEENHGITKSHLEQVKDAQRIHEIKLEETKRAVKEESENMERVKADCDSKLKLAQSLCKKYQDDIWNREKYYEAFIDKLNCKYLDLKVQMEQNLMQRTKDFELKEQELENKILIYERDSEFLSCSKKSVRARESKLKQTRVQNQKRGNKLVQSTRKCCRK